MFKAVVNLTNRNFDNWINDFENNKDSSQLNNDRIRVQEDLKLISAMLLGIVNFSSIEDDTNNQISGANQLRDVQNQFNNSIDRNVVM